MIQSQAPKINDFELGEIPIIDAADTEAEIEAKELEAQKPIDIQNNLHDSP